jgi:hypothetical protein
MAELIVVGFKKDMLRASEALNMLKDMNSSWIVDLHDAVAVHRDDRGKLRVEQSYQMTTGQGAGVGGLFGGLIGALLAAPFTGGASAVGAVIAAGSLTGVALGGTLGQSCSREGRVGSRDQRRHDAAAAGFRLVRAGPTTTDAVVTLRGLAAPSSAPRSLRTAVKVEDTLRPVTGTEAVQEPHVLSTGRGRHDHGGYSPAADTPVDRSRHAQVSGISHSASAHIAAAT